MLNPNSSGLSLISKIYTTAERRRKRRRSKCQVQSINISFDTALMPNAYKVARTNNWNENKIFKKMYHRNSGNHTNNNNKIYGTSLNSSVVNAK